MASTIVCLQKLRLKNFLIKFWKFISGTSRSKLSSSKQNYLERLLANSFIKLAVGKTQYFLSAYLKIQSSEIKLTLTVTSASFWPNTGDILISAWMYSISISFYFDLSFHAVGNYSWKSAISSPTSIRNFKFSNKKLLDFFNHPFQMQGSLETLSIT